MTFRDGGIEKRYLALVKGRWHEPAAACAAGLHKYLTGEGERRVSVSQEGKAAHSIVRLVARWENFSLVEVRTQDRAHAPDPGASVPSGFPHCGDDKYGDFALNKALRKQGLGRMFLHAAQLVLNHPLTGERLQLAAGLPDLELRPSNNRRAVRRQPRKDGTMAQFDLVVFRLGRHAARFGGGDRRQRSSVRRAISATGAPDEATARQVIGLGLVDALSQAVPGVPARGLPPGRRALSSPLPRAGP
jgi:hypothetical protein